jgi:hypothetical protein
MDPLLERLIPGSIGILITGGAGLYFVREIVRGFLSRSWPTVPGVITRSQRTEVQQKRGLLAKAWIEYRYEVDDQVTFGQRVCFGDQLTGNSSVVNERLRECPVGKAVQVRVNPRNWKDSTLLPRVTFMVWFWAILGCALAGVILNAVIFGE